jgi:hypothetical protein
MRDKEIESTINISKTNNREKLIELIKNYVG